MESSSSAQNDKPLVVRVKRKASQSPLEALWLEINDRPAKRALLDFASLSLDGNSVKEEPKSKKVLVQHVETVRVSETTVKILESIVTKSCETSGYNTKHEERRLAYKKEHKQDLQLLKARQTQEGLARNARFKQIWRSRMGDKEATHDENLREIYQFYDIVRVDAEERSSVEVQKREELSLEDQRLLSSYLPLLREHMPDIAADIETDICDYMSQQGLSDEDVYDIYAIKNNMDIGDEETNSFPLVQVEEEDWYYGADESSDNESYDSNAENHFLNDYPDEDEFYDEDEKDAKTSDSDHESEEDDEDVKTSDSDHESEEDENTSDDLAKPENSLRNDFEGADHHSNDYADGFDTDYYDDDDYGVDVGDEYGDFEFGDGADGADDHLDW